MLADKHHRVVNHIIRHVVAAGFCFHQTKQGIGGHIRIALLLWEPAPTAIIILVCQQPIQAEVLFAPEDPVRSRLLDVLKGASKSIRFLAFSFTDDDIGKLVLAQARKGVAVQGVFETTGSGTKFSEYGPFKAAGLDVRRDGDTKVILHHKLFIVDDHIVVTGSYNFSRNADKSNDENLLILNDANLARRYTEEFRRLYAQSQ